MTKSALVAPIPEPVHRKAPRPITNAVSLRERDVPVVTFDEIRKVCKYYQDKGTGHYTPKSKAGRYLFSVTDEVIKMLDELEKKDHVQKKEFSTQIGNYQQAMHDWHEIFGKSGHSPRTLFNKQIELQKQIENLESQILKEKLNHGNYF